MNRSAHLLDRLAYEPRRNAKIRLLAGYLSSTPDPERGWALAAITGALSFKHAKAGLIRDLAASRTDPELFALSYDYVGDLAETVALIWRSETARPVPAPGTNDTEPAGVTLSTVIDTLASAPKRDLPAIMAGWLDGLDETGRWALLKLVTGGLRVGVSARLAKTALAEMGGRDPDEVELVWPGLKPPYLELFAWVEGRAPKPLTLDPAPFRPPMLAHAIEDTDFDVLDPSAFVAEWKWDGIRVQAAAGLGADGRRIARLHSRSGEDVSAAFPDLIEALSFDGAIDGELVILREGRVQSFNVLQQRLNRKQASAQLIADYPAHIRAYDLLFDGAEDLRSLPFRERRARLEAFVARHSIARLDLSGLVAFSTWEELAEARANPASAGAGHDADAVEGLMIKRADSPYLPGRPKGAWFKWKRDPFGVDAVLMYAQRGHGKRSSFYSDFTFGVWRGDELVPVGKAYFGFTDQELVELDRFVRDNTTNRFGPVREVVHTPDTGLVVELAFEGLQRSTRHKSGLAMRFPRIARLRRDKRPADADH
ncbi:MAG: cisplatin damage response ATP-dependent DNA ligase, partial [Alphaproteobacteria bacterium]